MGKTLDKFNILAYGVACHHCQYWKDNNCTNQTKYPCIWVEIKEKLEEGEELAGTLNGIKVFVHPIIPKDEFVMGYNGDDMMTSAGVFAPYMAIVPTAELQYPDGGTTQGWSTLYDCRLLNSALLVRGAIVDEANYDANQPVSVHNA